MYSKAKFKYEKSDGTLSDRTIIKPTFLKESFNSLKDFNRPDVKYLSGYELDRNGLSEQDCEKYEFLLNEYLKIHSESLAQFLTKNGLDPNKMQQKSFKKEGVKDLNVEFEELAD